MEKLHLNFKWCLLLALIAFGGGKSWSKETWTYNSSATYTNGVYNKLTTSVFVKSSKVGRDGTAKAITGVDPTYIKTTQNGVLSLTIKLNNTNQNITIHNSSTGFSKTVRVTSSGVTITFNSVKDEEYEINIANKTGNVLITGSEFYPESEVLFISDTDSKADNDAKIKASTSKKMISLDRTLSSQYWNTFCLPMTINKLTISSQLKCDGTYILKSYDKSKNIIEFEKLEFVRANVPCLIKPTEDIVNPVLTGSNNIAFNETTLTATSNGLSFVGIYGYDDLGTDKTKFYLNTSGKLVYPTSSENNASKLRGFRAYFMLDEASAKNMTFIFDDSETTGISTIEHDVKIDDQKIYTIDGRFVGSSTEGLKKGIYISNGHKFVVNK